MFEGIENKMSKIKGNSLGKSPNKQALTANNANKEFFRLMQTHFIRNDLQKLMLIIELLKAQNPSEIGTLTDDMYRICERAQQKMDTVSRILQILESLHRGNLETEKRKTTLVDIFKDIQNEMTITLDIDYESLDSEIIVDRFFQVLFKEILKFIQYNNGFFAKIIGRRSVKNPDYFIVSIMERNNSPYSMDFCDKLLKGANEKNWDFTGETIELTLANLIASNCGGRLLIYPLEVKGNSYCIFLPYSKIG